MRGLNCQFLIQGVKPILYFDLVQGVSFSLIVCVLNGNQQSLLILIEPFNLKYMHNHPFRMTLPAFSTQGC